MNGYKFIWNSYIKWKNESNFYYNGKEYATFLLEHYKFDVQSYSSESKSRFQQLMRSKRILDDFEKYKNYDRDVLVICENPQKENSVSQLLFTHF